MNRREINFIFAVIVILLAAAAGISIFNKSGDSIIRKASVKEAPDNTIPENHPPEEVVKRLTALIAMSDKNPQNADILAEIGNLYYDLGEYDKAIVQYRKSLDIKPLNPYVETDLATCLYKLNRNDEALSILNNVLKYRPDFQQALYNKGIILIHGKNDPDSGIAAWEEMLKLDLDPARKAEIEQNIRQYKSSIR